MPGTGNSRAEAQQITATNAADLIKVQQLQTAYPMAGQYYEKEITAENFLAQASGGGPITANEVAFGTGTGVTSSDQLTFTPDGVTTGDGLLALQGSAQFSTAADGQLLTIAAGNGPGFGDSDIVLQPGAIQSPGTGGTFVLPGSANLNALGQNGGGVFSSAVGIIPGQLAPVDGNEQPYGYWMDTATLNLANISGQAGASFLLFSPLYTCSLAGISVTVAGAFITTDIVVQPQTVSGGTPTDIGALTTTVPYTGSGVGTTVGVTNTYATNFMNPGDSLWCTITGGGSAIQGVITAYLTRA